MSVAECFGADWAVLFYRLVLLNHPIYLWVFFVALLSMNLVGATQDIATDGLAVNILQAKQQHWGNTFQVVGSRLGFIGGGGAICGHWIGWIGKKLDYDISG